MKLIQTIYKLLVSIVLQILLIPIRIIKNIFELSEIISRVLKKTMQNFISEMKREFIK